MCICSRGAGFYEDVSRQTSRPTALSDRETEVLDLLAQGLTNARIAERLCISRSTVKYHIANLFVKLGDKDDFPILALQPYPSGLLSLPTISVHPFREGFGKGLQPLPNPSPFR